MSKKKYYFCEGCAWTGEATEMKLKQVKTIFNKPVNVHSICPMCGSHKTKLIP